MLRHTWLLCLATFLQIVDCRNHEHPSCSLRALTMARCRVPLNMKSIAVVSPFFDRGPEKLPREGSAKWDANPKGKADAAWEERTSTSTPGVKQTAELQRVSEEGSSNKPAALQNWEGLASKEPSSELQIGGGISDSSSGRHQQQRPSR